MKILVELRPALLGYAGIPQETRLLFRALLGIDGFKVDGLLQSGASVISRGLPSREARRDRLALDKRIDRLSRVVISLQRERRPRLLEKLSVAISGVGTPIGMVLGRILGSDFELTRFEGARFKDFVWRALFAQTLSVDDFKTVTEADFRIARVPWESMHVCAMVSRFLGREIYPRLATDEYDVMIGETPYPGTVSSSTRLVIRYHDAIPLLMPHTISDRFFHQAFHYRALRTNVRSGAWFACVSDATRKDLLSVFPEVEERSITIHNIVSDHYFPDDSSPLRIPEILQIRRNIGLKARIEAAGAIFGANGAHGEGGPPYLLIVSTIEPRKNHLTLVGAWELLRAGGFPALKLVVVGALGWEHKVIAKRLRPWVEAGDLHILADVPPPELRLLYRHARVTVCPSFGEGFDFSGVEAMRCGGVVAASDIPVHREIFGQAADYFSPYSAQEMATVISGLLGTEGAARRRELIDIGHKVARQYLPDKVLPRWEGFLQSLRDVGR